MTAAPASSYVRTFTAEDIPQVADLHRRVFGVADQTAPELLDAYQTYFTEVYLSNNWLDETAESLVYQDRSGKIAGFLAMMPRRMIFNERPVRARVTSQFVVDPECRGAIGLKLLSAAFAGPQDLTIADESNADSRILWEGLGGVTSCIYSMRWMYPLRPSQFALFVARRKKLTPAFLPAISSPFARLLDRLAARIVKLPARQPSQRVFGEDLDCNTLLSCLEEAGRKHSIRTAHDYQSLSWALQRAGQLRRHGTLQKALLRTAKQEVAGYYVYHLNPGGRSEVLLIHAKPAFARDVLDHLFHHAWRQGAIALNGRMEPALVQAFSDRHCLFHCGPQWTLVHSRRPELVQAFNRGDAGFSRLDGEWCLQFR